MVAHNNVIYLRDTGEHIIPTRTNAIMAFLGPLSVTRGLCQVDSPYFGVRPAVFKKYMVTYLMIHVHGSMSGMIRQHARLIVG